MKRFEYSGYELDTRSLPRIGVYDKYVHLFDGAHRILDVGYGHGLCLSALVAARGDQAEAIGVDSDERVTQCAQAQGLNAICSPGVEYLLSHPEHFDRVFCAHVVCDSVIDLIEASALALRPGGNLMMLLRNPESLEMQLSHFWEDPRDVRFYHGDLVSALRWQDDRSLAETHPTHENCKMSQASPPVLYLVM